MTIAATVAASLLAAQPHGIVLRNTGHDIAVSCTCLRITRRGRPGWAFIETRGNFPAAEAIAAYRKWHADRGVIL